MRLAIMGYATLVQNKKKIGIAKNALGNHGVRHLGTNSQKSAPWCIDFIKLGM
jgi:hypothetical protein